jgi:Lrp/AsnC family leucine-responsive transcriptional regulator
LTRSRQARVARPLGLTDPKVRIDELDRKLLARLQENGRSTSADLARRVGLSSPGLQKRLRRLEAHGVIRGYATLISREAVGLDLLCFVHVMLVHHRPDCLKRFPDKVKTLTEVLECTSIVLKEVKASTSLPL